MRFFWLIFAWIWVAAVFPCSAPAFEWKPRHSLEWNCVVCPVIVRGSVIGFQDQEAVVQVSEILRGDPDEPIHEMPVQISGSIGEEVLLFLELIPASDKAGISVGSWEVHNAVILDGRTSVETLDGQLTDPAAIVAYVKTQVRRRSELVWRWAASENTYERERSVYVLAQLGDQRSIAILRELLKDPATALSGELPTKWIPGDFFIRWEAWAALARMGIDAPAQDFNAPSAYGPVRVATWTVAMAAMVLIAALGAWWSVRQHRRINLADLGRPALRGAAGALLLALLVITCALMVRSRRYTDEMMFLTGQTHWQIASYRGGFHILRVSDWPRAAGILHGHIDRQTYPDFWAPAQMNLASRNDRWGFAIGHGDSPDPNGQPLPSTLLVVPHWVFALLLAPLPLTWLWRLRQARRRFRTGICPACGYDMHVTPGRCSECGWMAPAREQAAPDRHADVPPSD